ncbi:MAG: RNA polymerase sigma factor [Planctomycetes bacterium]|nr:RNA polymerase sigma factor [Planctomycetota bacterium]
MPRSNPEVPSDYSLVRAVADRRDRAAFTEIYARYQHQAMGLLYHILRSRDRAEDAMQEAFLRIWHSAHTLRDETNVRGWILRIVAREGARCYAAARERKSLQLVDFDRTPGDDLDQAEQAQDAELIAALERHLEKLDSAQRTVLALHFGGGLSQREIGEILSLTQQGVGHRINEALETLRLRLRQAGFAATLPLLTPDGLFRAITQGPAPHTRVLDGVLSKLDQGASYSARSTKLGGSVVSYWAAGVMIAAFGAAAAWTAARAPETNSQPATPSPAEGMQTTLPLAPVPKRDLFRKSWTFEAGIPKDITVMSGKWAVARNADDGTRTLAAAPGSPLILGLPVPNPAAPCRVMIEMNFISDSTDARLKILRLVGKRALPRCVWRDTNAGTDSSRRRAQVLHFDCDGRFEVTTFNGVLASVMDLESSPAFDGLYIEATAAVILSIEYSELDPLALPNDLPDPQQGIAELETRGIKAQKLPASIMPGM